jgi:cytochrome c553
MKIQKTTAALGVALALVAGPAAAQSTQDAAKAGPSVSMCVGCHGIPYYQTAFPQVYHVPKIAGQSRQYIVNALKAYKAGDRSHPSMQGVAKSLSDDDMAALAAYYGAAPAEAKK